MSLVAAFAAGGAFAADFDPLPDGGWIVDPEKSALSFTGVQTGKSFTGAFDRFDARIDFDPEDLAASSVAVAIDMASADAGSRQRNKALPGKDWFDVKASPQAEFLSEEIVAVESGYEARGTLTIRDVARPLVLPFTVDIAADGGSAVAKGGAEIIRTNFGVGQGEWESGDWVGLGVDVGFEITAIRAP